MNGRPISTQALSGSDSKFSSRTSISVARIQRPTASSSERCLRDRLAVSRIAFGSGRTGLVCIIGMPMSTAAWITL